jgi:putative ABC transport system substrate-binding protein
MGTLSRRRFVVGAGAAGLGLLGGCGRWPWQAEAPAKVYRIGWLISGPAESTSPPAPGASPNHDAFRQGLADYGYVVGQNVAIEYRATDQGLERLRELAAELVGLPTDVIVASATAAVAAKQATDTIPIVFWGGGDPVVLGLVPSLAYPGGNVTGVSADVQGALIGKRLELLKEAAPGIARVGILVDANTTMRVLNMQAAAAAAGALGLELQVLGVRSSDDLVGAFEMAVQAHVDGLLFVATALLAPNHAQIAELALRHRLPTISQAREVAEAGGLMAYGASLPALSRRGAYYVDRILRGAKPADLPVEQPMTFDFVVNLKTARELGITFPNEIMLQVTDVIQ